MILTIMHLLKTISTLFLVLVVCCWLADGVAADAPSSGEFGVMAWNIWHGGREDGEIAGPKRVAEVIQRSEADIVCMQETYGSGEMIAEELGFHFQPRGTNCSILSRFPISEDISVFEPFKSVGGLIDLPGGKRVAVYSIWLPYDKEIWAEGTREGLDANAVQSACEASAADAKVLLAAIQSRLDSPKYAGVPIVIAGDFNSMSHLDYTETTRDQYAFAIQWPTSLEMIGAGFRDPYRELHPIVDRAADRTWTPRFPGQQQDRIDYTYYRGEPLVATASDVIDTHAEGFPSDHAALHTKFRWIDDLPQTKSLKLKVVSYNIKRGQGNDGRVDLARTAEVLQKLKPDFVALQEVDERVSRSGNVNQAMELGKQLNMHPAFGSFMTLDEGRYGMACLSKYPVRHITSVVLPDGNEPRIALAVEVRLPGGESLMFVNVHFDWVDDDRYRFAQAECLRKYLDQLAIPYVLLGDFNDEPGSRTLELLSKGALEAKKPTGKRLTWSSTEPQMEIDFIFTAPIERWKVIMVDVIDETIASDHRPVIAELEFVGATDN